MNIMPYKKASVEVHVSISAGVGVGVGVGAGNVILSFKAKCMANFICIWQKNKKCF
jgi:hypothetical protein